MMEPSYLDLDNAGRFQQFLSQDREFLNCTPVNEGRADLPLHPHPFREVYETLNGDYVAVGRLPARDGYLSDGPDGATDPLYLAEFIRQGIEVISRVLLNVPFENTFILKKTKLTMDPLFDRSDDFADMDHMVVLPSSQIRRRRDCTAYAADGPFICLTEDQAIAIYDGTVAFLKPASYKTLRGGDNAPDYGDPQGWVEPLDPFCIGKHHAENVLIGSVARQEDGMTAKLTPQVRSPFFDRPLDHYPGMMMAEAARQLVVYMASLTSNVLPDQVRVTSIDMDFQSFAELNVQPTLRAIATGKQSQAQDFEVTVSQADVARARFVIQTRFDLQTGGAR